MHILFLGTSSFAVTILEALHEHHNVIGVITQPDKPAGRMGTMSLPPVKKRAIELGLNVLQPERASEIQTLIKDPFDFLITASYGKILPESVLKMPTKDALNVHCSLLPKYRGATPMQAALLHGDRESGVTVFRMVKELDKGPIFAEEKVEIPGDMMFPRLQEVLSKKGAELLIRVLDQYDSIKPVEQSRQDATFCKKITREDGGIDWAHEPAQVVWNKYRAYDPWPGIYTYYNRKMLKLVDIAYCPDINPDLPPGTVFQQNQKMTLVKTVEGSIGILKVQLAGKAVMEIQAFVNGQKGFVGALLAS